MKKITVGLIGVLLVIMLNSNAWAQSGLRIDLIGNGLGVSVSDSYSGLSTYLYYNDYPYPYYSRHYPSRPYLGWGGYNKHHHNHWSHHKSSFHHKKHHYGHQRSHKSGKHKYWGHRKSSPRHKSHNHGHQRSYKRDGHGQRHGKHNRQERHGRHWVR